MAKIRRRPLTGLRTVIKAHDAFDHDQLDVFAQAGKMVRDGFGPHGPLIEIVTGAACGCGVKTWIDIIRPDLGGCYGGAGACQGAQQGQRDDGLAAAGAWRCNDNGAAHVQAPTGRCGAGMVASSTNGVIAVSRSVPVEQFAPALNLADNDDGRCFGCVFSQEGFDIAECRFEHGLVRQCGV